MPGIPLNPHPRRGFLAPAPCILHRGVHSPADLPQPERPARSFGAEPGRADPLPQLGRVLANRIFLDKLCCSAQNHSMKQLGRSLPFDAHLQDIYRTRH